MRFLWFTLLFLLILKSNAQVVIDYSNMPSADDTFRISISSDSVDLSFTGANVQWDFSYLQPDSQRIDTAFAVTSTPLAYQLYFNNPFDQSYFSDYAFKGKDFNFQSVQITQVMDFFKNTSSALEQTGFGANINGVPSSNKYQPKELIYKFPLSYGDSDSSDAEFGVNIPNTFYYGQKRHRVYYCDGYGTVTTPFGTFDALRVKTVLRIQDTIYIDSLGFGFKISRPDEYIYTWLSPSEKYPVLKVTATDVFGTPVISAVEYRDNKNSSSAVATVDRFYSPEIVFNPLLQNIVISGNTFKKLLLIDSSGKVVLQKSLYQNTHSFHCDLPAGVYIYFLMGKDLPVSGKFIVP
ncbi:MAG: hypothetical protein D6707_03565 [Bacteroidetes bacterium]|nr:MAG: hypothetical protein D6707_03565 [Bacteroidota bacterium]